MAEMASYVREWDLEIVAEDFSPSCMAKALSGLTNERIMHYKLSAHAHAKELSAEPNIRKFQGMVGALIGR
jgi:chemotaxis methyl-accepting protein methylase